MPQPNSPANVVPSDMELATALLGPSAAMMQLWTQLRRLAPHARCVLLTGEAHCGQEAIARVLLELSPQRGRRFLVLTAAQAEASLVRSTGLTSVPQDALVFLPDVDQLSLAAQAGVLALLRMRRSRPFTVVAATGENLRALGSVGRFLPELADALAGVRIAVPALRQRKEDIPMLLTQLLSAESARTLRPVPAVGKAFLQAVLQHSWPGNLQELGRVAAALLTGVPSSELGAGDFASTLTNLKKETPASPLANSAPGRMVSLDTIVQEHIAAVLQGCRGNKLRAAEVLGISRSTLYRMLEAGAMSQSVTVRPEPAYCQALG